MITRGIIIGKLIDDLGTLQNQIDLRCQLGLTDLNRYCEDFFKDVINIIYSYNLKNLNEERSNEPGLDLGDEKNKIAYQITSTSTSEKVNNTLKKITEEQLKKYSGIKILMLGKKQKTYDAVDNKLMEKCSFSIQDIVDISDICKAMVSIPYENLFDLNKLFEREFQVVVTEIEIPDQKGRYPTNLYDKLETIPNTFCENASTFQAEYEGNDLPFIKDFFLKIGKLPRITREFLSILIELGENLGDNNYRTDYNILTRKLSIPKDEIWEEIQILNKAKIIYEPDQDDQYTQTRFVDSELDIIDFAVKHKYLNKILVVMDFTYLD